jgi:hypothetical protein
VCYKAKEVKYNLTWPHWPHLTSPHLTFLSANPERSSKGDLITMSLGNRACVELHLLLRVLNLLLTLVVVVVRERRTTTKTQM